MCRHELESIRSILGKPAYERGGILIYCGDCLQLMGRLEAARFGLTVTSPPYNIGKEYEERLSVAEYIGWCEAWIREVYRLTLCDGAFWLNLGYFSLPGRANTIPIPYVLWDRIPFHLIQEIVWSYGAGVACRKAFSPRNEKFLWYVKDKDRYTFDLNAVRDRNVKYPNQKKNGKLKCNPMGKNPTDVWRFPKVTSGEQRSSKERTVHPAQFPVAVIERIVRACSRPGDLLFDPFMGSGTLAEVAVATERMAVGFEINSTYVDIAAKRIDSAIGKLKEEARQFKLFAFK